MKITDFNSLYDQLNKELDSQSHNQTNGNEDSKQTNSTTEIFNKYINTKEFIFKIYIHYIKEDADMMHAAVELLSGYKNSFGEFKKLINEDESLYYSELRRMLII